MKIKVINPNTTQKMTTRIEEAAKSVARNDTEILATSPEMGPVTIESYYDDHLSIPGVLDEVRKGEAEGVDAFIIACYADSGLQAAREVTTRPVVGIAEASLYMTAMLAARFSIVTILPRMKVLLENLTRDYGMEYRLNSIRTLPSMDVAALGKDPNATMELLKEESRKAVQEDNAEAIILGGSGMVEFADELEKELGVPVIDGVAAAVKFAEAIVDLGKTTSKFNTYQYPEKKQMVGILSRFAYR